MFLNQYRSSIVDTSFCKMLLTEFWVVIGTFQVRAISCSRHEVVQATSRKVTSSFFEGAIWIFHWHNPSGRTMALRSTQPLTEMSNRNTFWGGRWIWPVQRADNLTTFMCRLSWNLGASTFWNPQGLSGSVEGLLYFDYYFMIKRSAYFYSIIIIIIIIIIRHLHNMFFVFNTVLL